MTSPVKPFKEGPDERHIRTISIVAPEAKTPEAQPSRNLPVLWAEETPPVVLPLQNEC